MLEDICRQAEQAAEELIEKAKLHPGQIVVIGCSTPPVPDHEGLFRTKKRNPGIHGVGLKSIGRIVARYHGVATMRFDPESKKFYHIVQFPMQEERKNRS